MFLLKRYAAWQVVFAIGKAGLNAVAGDRQPPGRRRFFKALPLGKGRFFQIMGQKLLVFEAVLFFNYPKY